MATPAAAQNACPEGSYSVSHAPDGTSLSILFDNMVVEAGGDTRKQCAMHIPLNLPENTSLGVYRVDYRGFALLPRGATAELSVDYNLGPRDNGRSFRRTTRGAHDGDFAFRENIGRGLMRRVGCGVEAALDVEVALTLEGGNAGQALATLDSTDGTARHGLIYYLELGRC